MSCPAQSTSTAYPRQVRLTRAVLVSKKLVDYQAILPANTPAPPRIATQAAAAPDTIRTPSVAAPAIPAPIHFCGPALLRHLDLNNCRIGSEGSGLNRQTEQSAERDHNRNHIFLHRLAPELNAPFPGTTYYRVPPREIQPFQCRTQSWLHFFQ